MADTVLYLCSNVTPSWRNHPGVRGKGAGPSVGTTCAGGGTQEVSQIPRKFAPPSGWAHCRCFLLVGRNPPQFVQNPAINRAGPLVLPVSWAFSGKHSRSLALLDCRGSLFVLITPVVNESHLK